MSWTSRHGTLGDFGWLQEDPPIRRGEPLKVTTAGKVSQCSGIRSCGREDGVF